MFQVDECKSSFHFIKGLKLLFTRDRPYFPSFGFLSLVGDMGKGKSLSAHKIIDDLLKKYPLMKIVSNTPLPFDYIKWESIDTIRNLDSVCVLLFFDEIQNQFNCVDSKSLPAEFSELLTFQRKRQMLIIGTSPCFSRISKAFRMAFDTICLCNNYGTFQVNKFFRTDVQAMALAEDDREAIKALKKIKTWFFFHTQEDYDRYNTYERVKVKL